jgi:hypothetical protein
MVDMANLIRHNGEWPETIFSVLFFTGTLWVVIGIFVDMLLILRVIILWWKVLQNIPSISKLFRLFYAFIITVTQQYQTEDRIPNKWIHITLTTFILTNLPLDNL